MRSAEAWLGRIFDKLGVRLSVLIAVALLPLGIIAVLQTQAVIHEAQGRSQSALMGVTLRAAMPEVRVISEARGAVQALAGMVAPLVDDPEACSRYMRELRDDKPQYSIVSYIPLNGLMTCSSSDRDFDYSGSPSFENVILADGPSFYVNPVAPVSGASIVGVTYPVRDAGGDRVGFVTIGMPHATLTANDRTTMAPLADRDVALVTFDGDGVVLSTSIALELAAGILPTGRTLQALAQERPVSFTSASVGGDERLYSVVPIVPGELYAMGSWSREVAEMDLTQSFSPLILPLAMWIASFFVAWIAANRLVLRHMDSLRRSMTLFASGGRVVGKLRTESAPIEIRELAESFLAMTDTILRDEAQLEDTIRQKEVLLREVHHRVKNNLQLIASIMSLQVRNARSPEAKRLIRGLQERVMSLATVHKELYQTSGLTDVHADELLSEIVAQIMRMTAVPGRKVDLQTRFDPIRLLPDQAVPLSLFVTEALTNALKYGLLAVDGDIRISLTMVQPEPDGEVTVEIGNSLPPEGTDTSGIDGGTGLGTKLLKAFSAQTGGGYITDTSGGEFRVILTFPPIPTESSQSNGTH